MAVDAPHPAGFSRFGVLDVLSSTTPRPSGRKPRWARPLTALAMKPGEKCRLELVVPSMQGGATTFTVLPGIRGLFETGILEPVEILNRLARQGVPVRPADDELVSSRPDCTIEGCQDTFHIVMRA
jgi:hypothetical protein